MRASNFSRSLLFAVRPDWALWRPMGAFQPSLGAKKLGLALGAQIAFWALSTFKHFCSLKSTIESSFKHYWLENTTELKLNSEFRLKETFFCLSVGYFADMFHVCSANGAYTKGLSFEITHLSKQ